MTQPDVSIEDQPVKASFNPDLYAWRDHLKVALDDLRVKVIEIDLDWKYYDGIHPRFWLTDTLAETFDNELAENMSENWVPKVVEAPVKRLAVMGWQAPDKNVDKNVDTMGADGEPTQTKIGQSDNSLLTTAAENVFTDNDLELEQKEIYRQVRAVGESYAFLWKDDEKEFGIDITINDARNVWWPKDAKRNDPDRVVKLWMSEEEGIWRATCYYRYAVVRLVGPKINQAKSVPELRWFAVDEKDPGGAHGFEKVPVIRFAMQRRRVGVIATVRHNQDKINKLVANKMVTAEFNAWGKTILMTEQEIEDGDLRPRPDRFLKLHPGSSEDGSVPTSIWESSPADLANYDTSIATEIDKLFTMADLPGHMQVKSTREVPSGAAYEADEGPFVEMLNDMQRMLGASWTDLMEMCDVADVKPQWENPAVRSDSDEATTVKTFVEAEVPVRLALKKYAGWTEEELTELDNQPLSAKEQSNLAMAQMISGVGPDAANAQGDPSEQDNAGSGGGSSNFGNANSGGIPPQLAK